MNQTLLIELLTEELPPKALAKLSDAFATGIVNGLKLRDLLEADSVAMPYATPRRLAVSITHVRASSPDKSIREKILPVSVALNAEDQPAAPLIKKLAALAQTINVPEITLSDLEQAPDGKADSFFYTYTASGSALHTGLQAALKETTEKLPIPKVMSYQRPDGSTVQFVRPAHRLIALHGKEIVPVTLLGLAAGRTTLGHRFLSQEEFAIPSADSYALLLETEGKVIASIAARKEKIRSSLLEKAGNDQVLMPEALLDEVSALVEWPVVYACHFEENFLTVPQECLILTMQTNQKYFALTDTHGRLRSRFLIVSNLETADPQHIIGGNERVVRPRLSDAKFFFEQDKKRKLADRISDLDKVVYHNKLGTQGERTRRVQTLASKIARMLDSNDHQVKRAAELAKADLLTDMVGEFPELQGIMGTYYARHDGESEEVALAISEHYQPRFAGDALPSTFTGTAVALADKLVTLVDIWSIGLHPTGDKDPFALRRHALGVLRMLVEKRLPLSVLNLLKDAIELIPEESKVTLPNSTPQKEQIQARAPRLPKDEIESQVHDFLFERLRNLLRERGYTPNEIEAVVAHRPDRLNSIIERLNAVQTFASLPEAESLAAANKRITNILKKAEGTDHKIHKGLLKEVAEEALYSAMILLQPQVDAAYAEGNFTDTLKTLAHLRNSVDAFFNDVMVMAEDEQLRNNRIALLSNLHKMMNQVADISKLAV